MTAKEYRQLQDLLWRGPPSLVGEYYLNKHQQINKRDMDRVFEAIKELQDSIDKFIPSSFYTDIS